MQSPDSLRQDHIVAPAQIAGDGRAPLTLWDQISLSALWLGINAVSAALAPIVLPVQVLLFIAPGAVGSARQAEFLGGLTALGAAVALLAPPLTGALSDRAASPFGRRRPYILVGVVIAVVGAWALARPAGLNALIIAALVLQLGLNVAVGAYQGLLPDITPESQRGAASGYLGLMTILGSVGSLALAGVLLAGVTLTNVTSAAARAEIINGGAIFYGAATAAMVVTAFITLVWTRETPLSAADVAALRRRRLRAARAGWRAGCNRCARSGWSRGRATTSPGCS